MTMLVTVLPSAATIPIASTNSGKAMIVSAMRLTMRSTQPPKKPAAPPAIDPNYLAEPEDLRVLVDGVRLARRIAAQPAFAAYHAGELVPGETVEDQRSVSQFVRERMETLYHPVGTCKMGCDADAVVDAKLRVRGVDGLRVVDASVMPVIPSGNTNAPTIMIAEKAAELFRQGR